MVEKNPPRKAKRADTARQLGIILLLLAVLLAVLIASGSPAAQPGHQPLAVSLPSGPPAYCAFPLAEDKSGLYSVSLEAGYNEVLAALKAGIPDAALIPADCLSSVDTEKYTAAAVTSYLNLVAVQNGGTAASIFDLNEKSVVVPSSLLATPEYAMLRFLLEKANASPKITVESDDAIIQRAQTGDFDIMLLPVDRCASVLLQNEGYRSCFNLAGQWTSLLGTTPPAGSVLVLRTKSMAENRAAAASLLASLRTGIDYANAKHKKASQLIKACGLGDDTVHIFKTLPHCMFAYLEGEAMNASLQQLRLVAETP